MSLGGTWVDLFRVLGRCKPLALKATLPLCSQGPKRLTVLSTQHLEILDLFLFTHQPCGKSETFSLDGSCLLLLLDGASIGNARKYVGSGNSTGTCCVPTLPLWADFR